MFVNDYGKYVPSTANNAADVITMTDIGGIGTLIYHTFRFQDYEYDEMPDGRISLKPLVYKGMEPDIDKSNSLRGSFIFSALYNLGRKINNFATKESFDELIIYFCKNVAHPYNIDSLYEILSGEELSVEHEGNLISNDAQFPIDDFKRDIENFYHGAQFFFALRQLSDGEDYDFNTLSEDGRYFDGLHIFDRYRIPIMPGSDNNDTIVDRYAPMTREAWKKELKKIATTNRKYEHFIEEYKSELDQYTRDPIYEFYTLRNKLMDMIPDFHMRLKVDPATDKVVFAADVHSVFDIAWYTLARYLVDVQLTDEGTKERKYSNSIVCVCKCCGKAFVRSTNENRKQYCGDPECNRKRARERTQRKRNKDKVEAHQKTVSKNRNNGGRKNA